jgi:dsRNA-specific ribonuclease
MELGQGCGSSKKEAQVAAAQSALESKLWEKAAPPKKQTKKEQK